jgi:hypothetical protein
MFRKTRLVILGAFALACCGCTSGVREQRIEIKESNDPLFLPRAALQRYADGQPLSSEVTSFPKMVDDVRKLDPVRADILEKDCQKPLEQTPAIDQVNGITG